MWRAICYQYMARRAANEFSYHLIVQTGGLAGELNSLVIVERAICGWKRVKAENPERTHTPPILFVTTRKTEAWKICSVENPFSSVAKISILIVNYWGPKTKRNERTIRRRQKRKWKSENSIWKTICLAICWANWTTSELFAGTFFLFAARVGGEVEVKKLRSDLALHFASGRETHTNHTNSVTLIRSVNCESWRIPSLSAVRVCVFFSL